MSTQPDSVEEQDQAHDIGQAHSDEIFSRTAQREREVGAAAGTHVDSHGDTVQNNQNSDSGNLRSSEIAGGSPSLYRKEGDTQKRKRMPLFNGKIQKYGPSEGVFATILFTMVALGGGSIGLFGNLLINIKELFLNDQSNHSRVNHIYSNAMFASKMTKGTCTGKVPILCRYQTMSERQIAKLERAGFTVERGEKGILGIRSKIISIRFPDRILPDGRTVPGPLAETARDFHRIANATIENARAVRLATNGRVAYYLNSKMFDIYDRYGMTKLKKLTSKNKADLDKDLDRNTNGTEAEGDDETRRKAAQDKASEDAKNATNEQYRQFTGEVQRTAGRAGNIAIVVAAVCGVYNLSHRALAYAKEYHIDQMMKYASLFMTEADAIKDLGDTTPESSGYAGDILTQYETNPKNEDGTPNEKYNKSATDSIGYRTTLGDGSPTPDYAKEFRAGGYSKEEGRGWLEKLSVYIENFEKGASYLRPEKAIRLNSTTMLSELASSYVKNGGDPLKTIGSYLESLGDATTVDDGREALRYYCQQAGPVAYASFIVVCGIAGLGLFTEIATAPSAATIAMCAIGAACMIPGPTAEKCRDVLQKMLELGKTASDKIGATDYVLSLLQSGVVGSFLKGVVAGEAWFSGFSFMGSAMSAGYGLRPATDPAQAQHFIASTQGDMQMEEKLAYADARDTPFDVSNRHSLFGSVVWNLQPYYDKNAPVFSGLASIFSAIPNAIKSQDPTVSAYYTQPVSTPAGRYDCEDPDLISIGIKKTDRFCNTVGVMTDAELAAGRKQAEEENKLIEENVEYMTTPQTGNERDGGTYDDSFCDINPQSSCQEDNKKNSTQPSIDQEGKVIPNSQYDKFINYCTEQRKSPWGMFTEAIQAASSTRDIDWFTGKQCLSDSNMMVQFRTQYNMCTQSATMDDSENCWGDDTQEESTSECAGGGRKAIYTCAVKYDDYGYKWGGGHSDIPNAEEWIADFNAGKVQKWTHILDCSGLVRMAYVEAMGTEDQAYVAPDGYNSSKYWDKISIEEAEQGDIITQDGHVAIVEAPYDKDSGTIKIFHASTSDGPIEDNIKHATVSKSSILGVYRGKKGSDIRA